MRTQANQLEDRLLQDGWRIIERETAPHWWADELWTIESIWRPRGRRLWITFLIDPSHDGVRHRGEHVWAVGVTQSPPATPAQVNQTAVPIRHGWTSHLEEFVGNIRLLRDQDANSG